MHCSKKLQRIQVTINETKKRKMNATLVLHTVLILAAILAFLLLVVLSRFFLEQVFNSPFSVVVKECGIYAWRYTRFVVIWMTSSLVGAFVGFLVVLYVVAIQLLETRLMINLSAIVALLILVPVVVEVVRTWKRRHAFEYIDLGPEKAKYTMDEYYENMSQIGTICKLTSADLSVLSSVGFEGYYWRHGSPASILDVGCGGGWLCFALNQRFPSCKITGIEISEQAIEFAKREQSEKKQKERKPQIDNITFRKIDHVDLREPEKSVDIVTCSLVTHHIPDDEDIIIFLQRAGKVAKKAVIINDLERDPIAVLAFQLFMYPLYSNKLTRHDGLLSIRRSFTKSEWRAYLRKAGYRDDQFSINWCPISRFTVYINVATDEK